MPKPLLFEELHLQIIAPSVLTVSERRVIRRTLDSSGFQRQMKLAINAVMHRYRSLQRLTIKLSQ